MLSQESMSVGSTLENSDTYMQMQTGHAYLRAVFSDIIKRSNAACAYTLYAKKTNFEHSV